MPLIFRDVVNKLLEFLRIVEGVFAIYLEINFLHDFVDFLVILVAQGIIKCLSHLLPSLSLVYQIDVISCDDLIYEV